MAEATGILARDRRPEAGRRGGAPRRLGPRGRRADPAQPQGGAGSAGRALHHGGEARLALGRGDPAGGGRRRARPRLSRRRGRDQRAHRRALFRRVAGGSARGPEGISRAHPRQGFHRRPPPGRRGAAARRGRGARHPGGARRRGGGGGDGGGAAARHGRARRGSHRRGGGTRGAARRRHHRDQQSRSRHIEGRSRNDRAAVRLGARRNAGRRRIRNFGPGPTSSGSPLSRTPSWSAPR